MQKRLAKRLAIPLALALLSLISLAIATLIITYNVTVTPTVVKSPVIFENGLDDVSTIDNINQTRASVNAKIFPLVQWFSPDALRIHNVNGTQVKVKLRALSVSDPNAVIQSFKIYLVINATEYLAIELGPNGTIVQGESSYYTMNIDETYTIKLFTQGKDGIIAGQTATINLGVEATNV